LAINHAKVALMSTVAELALLVRRNEATWFEPFEPW
jgi:hypothetical protein